MRALWVLAMVAGCGRSHFDEVPPDGVPPGFCDTATFPLPGASTLHDDFTTPYTDRWAPINPTAPCIQQVGTELVAAPAATGEFCHAYTRDRYHLTCDAITMHVPQTTSAAELGVQTFLYVYVPSRNVSLAMIYELGGVQLGIIGDPMAMQLAGSTYDPTDDAWWRLREHDGELAFDGSPDGITWRELMRTPTPLPLDEVEIALGAGTYMTVASPGEAHFRCYNVPPPCN